MMRGRVVLTCEDVEGECCAECHADYQEGLDAPLECLPPAREGLDAKEVRVAAHVCCAALRAVELWDRDEWALAVKRNRKRRREAMQ